MDLKINDKALALLRETRVRQFFDQAFNECIEELRDEYGRGIKCICKKVGDEKYINNILKKRISRDDFKETARRLPEKLRTKEDEIEYLIKFYENNILMSKIE